MAFPSHLVIAKAVFLQLCIRKVEKQEGIQMFQTADISFYVRGKDAVHLLTADVSASIDSLWKFLMKLPFKGVMRSWTLFLKKGKALFFSCGIHITPLQITLRYEQKRKS